MSNERLGYDVAALGDVNNDGCDDFVVGARSEDLGVNNQGPHVIFDGAVQVVLQNL